MFRAALFASSGRAERARIHAGLKRAQAAGIELNEVPEQAFACPGEYLAGDDSLRLDSLKQALAAPSDIAWAVRGGYGLTRLIPFESVALEQKPIVGFSDVTALLAATYQAGGCAIHGPVLTSFAEADAASQDALRAAIDAEARQWQLHGEGAGFEAPIIGGNLEVLTRLIGTAIQPEYKGKVVVLEEVGEPWYRCDRALTHLLASTDLNQARAIVFGAFVNCGQGALERLVKRVQGLGLKALSGAPVGHGSANQAFVWGERAVYEQGTLTLTGARP